MTFRVDAVIEKVFRRGLLCFTVTHVWQVREYHKQYKEKGTNTRDVLIVAHGHFSRVLIARWINCSIELGSHLNVEPGGVGISGLSE